MDLDVLIKEELVNFRKEVLGCLKEQHPHVFGILDRVLSGRKNMVGLKVLEADITIGNYTFILNGIDITEVKSGILESEVHHPFLGVIKPYVTIERNAIETMIKDEQFKKEPFSTLTKYLPDLTFKFLR
ncbi:MAG: hypothetical protein LLG02_16640 [Pelosinus sp.]|nr:hypothetical protein [Pelosinus sp.]